VSVRVHLPPVLRHIIAGERCLDGEGGSITSVLADLAKKHPAVALHLFDEQGAVRHNIVCVHNGDLVRARQMSAHAVASGDELILANALAGG
jgi:hypothetical protein